MRTRGVRQSHSLDFERASYRTGDKVGTGDKPTLSFVTCLSILSEHPHYLKCICGSEYLDFDIVAEIASRYGEVVRAYSLLLYYHCSSNSSYGW